MPALATVGSENFIEVDTLITEVSSGISRETYTLKKIRFSGTHQKWFGRCQKLPNELKCRKKQ